MNSITEQELHPSLKQKIDKIDQLEKTQNSNGDLKEIKKDIDSLKSSVDNGKNSLYSAIIGKKVTPRSKDFNDLTNAVKDISTENTEQNKKYESQIQQLNTEKSQLQNQIKSIKPAKGNAQPYQVSENATFTNDSGELQHGILKTTALLNIKPSKEKQIFNTGIYGTINVEPITDDIITKNFNSDEIFNIINIDNLSKNNVEKFINVETQKYPKVCKKYAEGEFIEEGEFLDTRTRVGRYSITGLNFKPSTIMCHVECGMHYMYCYSDELSDFLDFKSVGYNHGICEKFNSEFTSNGFEIYCGDIRAKKVKIKWIAYS